MKVFKVNLAIDLLMAWPRGMNAVGHGPKGGRPVPHGSHEWFVHHDGKEAGKPAAEGPASHAAGSTSSKRKRHQDREQQCLLTGKAERRIKTIPL